MLSRVPTAASRSVERTGRGMCGSGVSAAALSEYEMRRGLDDAVVEVGGDARRSSAEASTARTRSASRSCWLLRSRRASRYASGTCEPEEDEAGEQEAGEGNPDPAPRRGDGGAALVRLVEERSPVRRPDREIDLVQAALVALETVLRAGQVAELGSRRSGTEDLGFAPSSGYRDDQRGSSE